jgi:hypothetical protein
MRRTSILTFGCLLGIAILIGQLLARPTSGQGEAAVSRTPGRFQMSMSVGGVVVCDTTTGRCWVNTDKEKWEDLGSPVEPKK